MSYRSKAPTKRSKPNYWYSIVSVAMVLFLLGFFGLLLLQTKRVVDIVNVEAFGQYTMGRNYGVEFAIDF